jgi:hypothetical protein
VAQNFESVDDYIATFPLDVQTALQAVRDTIHAAAPGATESISYPIPTFTIGGRRVVYLVSWSLSSFAVGVVQVRASQGRRGRDTGSYVDRGERREVRAWAARTVKRLRLRDTSGLEEAHQPLPDTRPR